MKKLYFSLVLFLLPFYRLQAGCGVGQAQVIVTIVPDNYPEETSWSLYDAIAGTLIDTGGYNSDTICVGASQCLKFNIYDSQGDGMCCEYGNGHYTVKLNGSIVDSGSQFTYSQYAFFNCPQGHDCSNPYTALLDTMTAPKPETWYAFTPDSSGIYDIETCNLGNICEPVLYVYDHCSQVLIVNNNEGTTFYADSNCYNQQALVSGYLSAGHTYYIRIGQNLANCAGDSIHWLIKYDGPVVGCTDPNACNYNPLATVSDGSCVYPPNPICPAPDLTVVQSQLAGSLSADSIDVGAINCYVGEGCLGGYGMRRLIRFTTEIRNIGNQGYYLGTPDTAGGLFLYDDCHHHWHFIGYAEYLLFDANNRQIQTGFKNGFCVEDSECDSTATATYGCSDMGISSGCGDVYVSGLDCQWIDITDVDTGNYTLAVVVNWNHKPDRLGHYERTYSNNWAQVCVHIYYNNLGQKVFNTLADCSPYVDCAGDTFGTAEHDCKGICNGSAVYGDINADNHADSTDIVLYLDGIVNDTISYTQCSDLNGDGLINITDVVRLSGCILYNEGLYHTSSSYQNTHKHCEFPFNVPNPYDTAVFSIAAIDTQNHYVDISIYNPNCPLLAFELKLHGLVVDSVKNLAIGGYNPTLYASSTGHMAGIALDGNPLYLQYSPLKFLRVCYSSFTDTLICIEQVVDVSNGNYEQVKGSIGNSCVNYLHPTGIDKIVLSGADVSIIPNPTTGSFNVYCPRQILFGATFTITDMTGRLISSYVSETLSNNFTIDLGDKESGIYLLNIRLNDQNLTKRLVLIR